MKKLTMTLCLATVLFSGYPKQAKAEMILEMVPFGHGSICGGLNSLGLLLLFPFCFLDENGEERALTKKDLMSSLYSEEEADTIMRDQAMLMEAIKNSGANPKDLVLNQETIRRFVPNISDVYLNFIHNN